ncbi:MAG: hypothetical protein ACKPKO_64650, partial [Candidatus Fonsibacter sp.]
YLQGEQSLAQQWQEYSGRTQHTSRPFEYIQHGHLSYTNHDSHQLSFFLSNFDKLLRRPGEGNQKMKHYTSDDPDAYEISLVIIAQPWARNWGYIRATCESGGLNVDKCREYGLDIGSGQNTILSQ